MNSPSHTENCIFIKVCRNLFFCNWNFFPFDLISQAQEGSNIRSIQPPTVEFSKKNTTLIVTSSTIDIFFEITNFSKILSKFTYFSNILSKFDNIFEFFRKKCKFRKYFRKFCNFEKSVMVDEVNITTHKWSS